MEHSSMRHGFAQGRHGACIVTISSSIAKPLPNLDYCPQIPAWRLSGTRMRIASQSRSDVASVAFSATSRRFRKQVRGD